MRSTSSRPTDRTLPTVVGGSCDNIEDSQDTSTVGRNHDCLASLGLEESINARGREATMPPWDGAHLPIFFYGVFITILLIALMMVAYLYFVPIRIDKRDTHTVPIGNLRLAAPRTSPSLTLHIRHRLSRKAMIQRQRSHAVVLRDCRAEAGYIGAVAHQQRCQVPVT